MAETDDIVVRLRRREELFAGGTTLVNPDGPEAAAEIEKLTKERKDFIRTVSEWATKAGEAEGRLTASEWPGVVEGWKARAATAERERDEARAEVERKDAALAPFAAAAARYESTPSILIHDDVELWQVSANKGFDLQALGFTVGHLRDARAALTAGGEHAET